MGGVREEDQAWNPVYEGGGLRFGCLGVRGKKKKKMQGFRLRPRG